MNRGVEDCYAAVWQCTILNIPRRHRISLILLMRCGDRVFVVCMCIAQCAVGPSRDGDTDREDETKRKDKNKLDNVDDDAFGVHFYVFCYLNNKNFSVWMKNADGTMQESNHCINKETKYVRRGLNKNKMQRKMKRKHGDRTKIQQTTRMNFSSENFHLMSSVGSLLS